MFLKFTGMQGKRVIVNSDNITFICDHEISGTVIHFRGSELRIAENMDEVLSKIKLK